MSMTEAEFDRFIDHIADAAIAFDKALLLDSGPTISARWDPDEDGFSRIEISLRWLERTPLDELSGDELASETTRRSEGDNT